MFLFSLPPLLRGDVRGSGRASTRPGWVLRDTARPRFGTPSAVARQLHSLTHPVCNGNKCGGRACGLGVQMLQFLVPVLIALMVLAINNGWYTQAMAFLEK
jgi:hypothetical protein